MIPTRTPRFPPCSVFAKVVSLVHCMSFLPSAACWGAVVGGAWCATAPPAEIASFPRARMRARATLLRLGGACVMCQITRCFTAADVLLLYHILVPCVKSTKRKWTDTPSCLPIYEVSRTTHPFTNTCL